MALDKAIKSGKEKRKPYYDSKRFDSSCRNHGRCGYCEGNRTYAVTKSKMISEYDETLEEPYERKIDT